MMAIGKYLFIAVCEAVLFVPVALADATKLPVALPVELVD
jgi:hypothetical protein